VYPMKTLAVAGVVTALGAASGVGLYSASRERRQTAELAATNQSLTATMAKLESQLDDVTRKLAELQAERTVQALPERGQQNKTTRAPRRAARPANDSRIDQLRARINEQEQEIAGTKDQLQQARADLQGRLDSTRDELNGSIARTHDDVVALQKRGERNYYEFEADKSKQFQRVGPIRLSLRKADLKHKRYDVALMVDDFEIQKKGVNLFEPVWITVADRAQPLELVVNRVHKDQVGGYLSEARYKTAELSAANSNTPASNGRRDGGLQK
jgi:hypothetical protein